MKNSENYAGLIAHALSKVPTGTLCDTFCQSLVEGCYSCMMFNPDKKSCRKSEKEWLAWLTQEGKRVKKDEEGLTLKKVVVNVSRAIAIDFDGTLCENKYPNIGEPKWDVINRAKKEKESGSELILLTMREGELLNKAITVCKEWGLTFDAVNDNLESWRQAFGNNPRKIGATEYWDDRAYNANEIKPYDCPEEMIT